MTATHRIATVALTVLLGAAGSLAAQASAGAQKRPATTGQHKAEAAEEQEHTVPAARVPAPVREAFARAYPHARANKYSTEVENGRTVYEVESTEGATKRDLLIGIDGTILETETQVTAAQLPAAVRTAAQANGAHIQLAELVVAGRDTTYEMKIRGRRGELKLLPNGQPVPAAPHN